MSLRVCGSLLQFKIHFRHLKPNKYCKGSKGWNCKHNIEKKLSTNHDQASVLWRRSAFWTPSIGRNRTSAILNRTKRLETEVGYVRKGSRIFDGTLTANHVVGLFNEHSSETTKIFVKILISFYLCVIDPDVDGVNPFTTDWQKFRLAHRRVENFSTAATHKKGYGDFDLSSLYLCFYNKRRTLLWFLACF